MLFLLLFLLLLLFEMLNPFLKSDGGVGHVVSKLVAAVGANFRN
jgi:hypothetical protein